MSLTEAFLFYVKVKLQETKLFTVCMHVRACECVVVKTGSTVAHRCAPSMSVLNCESMSLNEISFELNQS